MFSALPALLVWQLSKGNLVGETSMEEHINCFPVPFPGTLRTGANVMANLLKLTVPRRLCRAWWSGGPMGSPWEHPCLPHNQAPLKFWKRKARWLQRTTQEDTGDSCPATVLAGPPPCVSHQLSRLCSRQARGEQLVPWHYQEPCYSFPVNLIICTNEPGKQARGIESSNNLLKTRPVLCLKSTPSIEKTPK